MSTTQGPDDPVRRVADLPGTVDETLTAQQQGRRAAAAGQPVSVCPYRLDGTETPAEAERTRYLQLMWSRGFRVAQAEREATRPPAPTAEGDAHGTTRS